MKLHIGCVVEVFKFARRLHRHGGSGATVAVAIAVVASSRHVRCFVYRDARAVTNRLVRTLGGIRLRAVALAALALRQRCRLHVGNPQRQRDTIIVWEPLVK